MLKRKSREGTTIHISDEAHGLIRSLCGKQGMSDAVDTILSNHVRFLSERVKYADYMLPDELMKRLELRLNKYQTMPSLISDLIDLADKVEGTQVIIPPQTRRS